MKVTASRSGINTSSLLNTNVLIDQAEAQCSLRSSAPLSGEVKLVDVPVGVVSEGRGLEITEDVLCRHHVFGDAKLYFGQILGPQPHCLPVILLPGGEVRSPGAEIDVLVYLPLPVSRGYFLLGERDV